MEANNNNNNNRPYGFTEPMHSIRRGIPAGQYAEPRLPPPPPAKNVLKDLIVYAFTYIRNAMWYSFKQLCYLPWRMVRACFMLFITPYVFIYNKIYEKLAPIILPPINFLIRNRWPIIKYTLLAILYVVVAFWMAVALFFIIRYSLLIKEHSQEDLFFDFNKTLPVAQAHFTGDSLELGQLYSAYVDLELPESPNNVDLGMFMISLELQNDGGLTITETSRPCIMRYKTGILRIIHTLTYAVPSLLGFYEEKQILRVTLTEDILPSMNSEGIKAIVTLSRPQIEVYSAQLHFQATLSYVSYMLHYWPITTFFLTMPLLFATSCMILLFWVTTLYLVVTGRRARRAAAPPAAPHKVPAAPGSGRVISGAFAQPRAQAGAPAKPPAKPAAKPQPQPPKPDTPFKKEKKEKYIEDPSSSSEEEEEEEEFINRFWEEDDDDVTGGTPRVTIGESSSSRGTRDVEIFPDYNGRRSIEIEEEADDPEDLDEWVPVDKTDENSNSNIRRRPPPKQ